MEFETQVDISASPDKVFGALCDVDSFAKWMPNLVSIKRTGEGPLAQGSEFAETRKMFGHQSTEHFTVRQWDPPARLLLYVDGSKGTTGKGEYLFDHLLEATESGTRLTLCGHMDMPGLMAKVMGKLMGGAFKKAIDKDLAALKNWIESAD